jgi:predicted nucleic acid-binding protein
MKVVVADTSPLNYLVLTGEVDVLALLYREVLVPDIVIQELRDANGPFEILRWASQLPSWINVQVTPFSAELFDRLDAGERAAILLAEAQKPPVLLLMDDADGRAEAERRHIATTGTLGVLRAAAIRGLTDLPKALARLKATNFRCAASLIDGLLAEDAQRRLGKTPRPSDG